MPVNVQAAAEIQSACKKIFSSPRFRHFNTAAKERFDQTRIETQVALDRCMADALTLYYDNRFQKAFLAFESFPASYRTTEFLYLHADAALKAAAYDTAIDIYRQLLSMDPHLDPVRLDLAVAYYKQGKPDASRAELHRIEEDMLPDYLRSRMAQLEELMGEPSRKYDLRFYLSQNIQWDSNIGATPDEDRIMAPNGALYRFTGSSGKQSDWRSETLVKLYWDYKPYAEKGFRWESVGTVYNLEYFKTDGYDSFLWKVRSGPGWTLGKIEIEVPLTYGQRFLSDSPLYDLYGIAPEFTYAANRRLRVKGKFGYFKKSYSADEDDALNKYIRSYEVKPIFYYNPSWDYISLSLIWKEERAESRRYSNDILRASFSTRRRLGEGLRGYFRYSHRIKKYETPFPGWASDREDDENSLYFSLVKKFKNGLSLDTNFYWAKADSNTQIFDYDRIICGVGIGFNF